MEPVQIGEASRFGVLEASNLWEKTPVTELTPPKCGGIAPFKSGSWV